LWLLTVLTITGLLVTVTTSERGPDFSAASVALWYSASALTLTGLRRLCLLGERRLKTAAGKAARHPDYGLDDAAPR
jgi:hypothetical protein